MRSLPSPERLKSHPAGLHAELSVGSTEASHGASPKAIPKRQPCPASLTLRLFLSLEVSLLGSKGERPAFWELCSHPLDSAHSAGWWAAFREQAQTSQINLLKANLPNDQFAE